MKKKKIFDLVIIVTFLCLLTSCDSNSDISHNMSKKQSGESITTQVSLSQSSIDVIEGEVYSLVASVYPTSSTNQSLKWSSSNLNVASVNSGGMIVANNQGTATITVTTTNDKTATCFVNVLPRRTYVSLSSSNINKYFEISTFAGAQIGNAIPITVTIYTHPDVNIERNVTISVQATVSINYKTPSNSTLLTATSSIPVQLILFSGTNLGSSSQSALVFFGIPFDSIITTHSVGQYVVYTFGEISIDN